MHFTGRFLFFKKTVITIRMAMTTTIAVEMVTLIIARVSPFIVVGVFAVAFGVVEVERVVRVVREGGWWVVEGVRWGE